MAKPTKIVLASCLVDTTLNATFSGWLLLSWDTKKLLFKMTLLPYVHGFKFKKQRFRFLSLLPPCRAYSDTCLIKFFSGKKDFLGVEESQFYDNHLQCSVALVNS